MSDAIFNAPLTNLAQILGLGPPELIIILVILLLLFGAKKLPELARSLGKSAKELRDGLSTDGTASKTEAKTDDAKQKKS